MDINGEVVTDATIVTPKDAGCVGAVRHIEHPISLGLLDISNSMEILLK